jgi:hypothetical protein
LGWTGDDAEHQATTTLATIEFSGGGMGAYDFTDNQWHNPLHSNSRRIVIRASRGEIVDDRVVRLVDAQTVVESSIVRRQTGWDLNLEGFHLVQMTAERPLAVHIESLVRPGIACRQLLVMSLGFALRQDAPT